MPRRKQEERAVFLFPPIQLFAYVSRAIRPALTQGRDQEVNRFFFFLILLVNASDFNVNSKHSV